MKISKDLTFALAIAVLGAGSVRAESWNGCDMLPSFSGGANTFSIVYAGNVLSSLNLAQTQNDPTLNPFLYVNQNYYGGAGTTSVTAMVVNGNTVVTFTGSNPITSSDMFTYGGTGNGLPHFGLDSSVGSSIAGGGPSLNLVSQTWSNTGNSNTLSLPGPSVSVVNPPSSGPVNYVTVFATVTSGTGASAVSTSDWKENPYTPGTAPMVTITNYTTFSVTLSDVGYFLSPTLIPLDDLNYGVDPPTGTIGSPFISLPSLDGTILAAGDGMGGAGGSITTQGLPEPSTIISMATGLLVVAGYLVRRRLGGRPGRATASA